MTKTKTRTVTRFIIALCPASKVYLASLDPVFREGMNLGQATVGLPSKATHFDCFDDALAVAKTVKGWLGWRVEEIAVEIPDNRLTLDTPEARIEVRDNATAQYNAAREAGYAERNAAEEVANDLRGCGLKVAVVYREDASCAVTIALADHLGNLLDLDYDVLQDGFAYETEGDDACDLAEDAAQHEDEPDTVASFPKPIFLALVGLTVEQKIVALANALHFAGVTIHRVDEDGAPIIRASTPTDGTATVLNI